MTNISMVEAKLPPGFRFYPRDEELVCDYLMKKVTRSSALCLSPLLIEVDLNKCEPWDLPETACVGGKEWYFYTQRDRKYATGERTNRATVSGYWKATGKDKLVYRKGTLVGMRKTLVFYRGRAPKGRKSDWVMHEFRLQGPLTPSKLSFLKEDWVLCRVFYKKIEIAANAKPSSNVGSSCLLNDDHDDTAGSPYLPPLMDSYINFDQAATTHNLQDQVQVNSNNITINNNINDALFQQVPCFSVSSSQNQIFMEGNESYAYNTTSSGILPNGMSYLDPFSCDQKVLTVALDHLSKMESNPKDVMSESCFMDQVGIPNIWNH